MNRQRSLSVITLTRNRAPMLSKYLGSLVGQLSSEDEIIVVDNGSTDSTRDIILQFQTRLPIRYFTSSRVGYPALYNIAIKKSAKEVLVFLDDDCIATPKWRESIARSVLKHPGKIIQGKVISIPKGNIYAEIMGDHYQNWIVSHRNKSGEMDTFDNKHLIVPKKYLYKNKTFVGFDPLTVLGSEDIELGTRLYREGKIIQYDESIVAYHRERTTFRGFLQQHFRIAMSERLLSDTKKLQIRLSLFPVAKTRSNLISLCLREITYLKRGEVWNLIYAPFLYLLLFVVRICGYFS